MRKSVAVIFAALLLFSFGCKDKYVKACENVIEMAAKEKQLKGIDKDKALEKCKPAIEVYTKALDCIAEAGKLADLEKCGTDARKEGMKMASELGGK